MVIYVIYRCEKGDSTAIDTCGARKSEIDAEYEIVVANAENGAFHYYYEEVWLQ